MDKKKKMDTNKFKQFCYVLWHFLKNVLPRLSLVAFWNNELFFLCAQFSLGPTEVLHRLHWCQYLKVFTICIFNQSAKQPCKKKKMGQHIENNFPTWKLRFMEVEVIFFPRKRYKDTKPCQLVFSLFLFVVSLRL